VTTKLFLRASNNTGIVDGTVAYRDLLTTAGSSAANAIVDTQASGTEIQWTIDTTGDVEIQWMGGYTPRGGFILTSVTVSIWAEESSSAANCGGRVRLFKRSLAGVETEIAGGPFDDGVELSAVGPAEMTWTANVTDTQFNLNDRPLLKIYITNVGTMGGSQTCTLVYDAADAATGDSFIELAETVTFSATQVPNTGLIGIFE